MLRLFAIWFLTFSIAWAEEADVPHLPNGTTDIDAVFASFSVNRSIYAGENISEFQEFNGEILGTKFHAIMEGDPLTDRFTLTIWLPGRSAEATYITAVLLNDITCMNLNRTAVAVNWPQNALKLPDAWRITSSCQDGLSGSAPSG
jgi:hypothetical protein